MIRGYSPVTQAFLGTLFTWAVTAAGAGLVFVFKSGQRKVLDGSLGFAAGVMLAASYWSLLNPAIEMAESSGYYGENGWLSFIPVSIGFTLGAAFVYGADYMMSYLGIESLAGSLTPVDSITKKQDPENEVHLSITNRQANDIKPSVTKRKMTTKPTNNITESEQNTTESDSQKLASWRRIMLLIIAITVHNIPEGLAVGVGFGAISKSPSATFENARNLAIGIGIQNFPEGLAVSLPLRASGISVWWSFWYGQLSGMVEPIAGILGAFAVTLAEPVLPYALSFAAGAMVYVVVDDIIPEAQTSGNGKLASWTTILGFVIMMSLDVGLG
ncbi:predicted protein [Nematostella vectensis]|uniref:Zinc transporter ZIP11 n=1 Tax=Nematostella vectensis TaxID=45351 RepID=A7S891_NEMVE|nr:zinc transporter ZIP11 [Nematostella vectensis]EDO40021.1 predicted protein [Nematostella vectensis]|eukprot:XP_001632084.1 predicted protein [Nematostella vectensis]